MYTDMSLQHEALKDIVEKALKPTKKRQLVDCSRQKHGMSIRSAYEAIGISRTVYHYQPDIEKDIPVITVIQAIVGRYHTYGFSRVLNILKKTRIPNGITSAYTTSTALHCSLSLNMRRKYKKRLPNSYPVHWLSLRI